MAIERVCVIGGGVIGSLYAAHLAQRVEVTVLTRRDYHARALTGHGLTVSGKSEFTARLAATADAHRLDDFDLDDPDGQRVSLSGWTRPRARHRE